jgi:hypothetical protein
VEDTARDWAQQTGAPLVVDAWQAALMAQRLRAAGLTTVEVQFTAETRRKLFGSLLDVIRRGQLRSKPHPELRRELLGLEVQQTPTGFRVDHKSARHDDHVMAVALALGAFWDEATQPVATPDDDLEAEFRGLMTGTTDVFGAPTGPGWEDVA